MVEVFRTVMQFALEAVDVLVTVLVVGVVALVALRWMLLKLSPFSQVSFRVREWTDPILWPIAQVLPTPGSMGLASLLAVLIVLLGAYFFKEMFEELMLSLLGLIGGVASGAPVQSLGWLLYGAVSVLLLLIVLRIVLSWLPFAREARLMWTLYSLTEPVMAPFRQLIPPLGMFDLSPILLIFLLGFVKNAIRSLLIH